MIVLRLRPDPSRTLSHVMARLARARVSYGDARWVLTRRRFLAMQNAEEDDFQETESVTLGVRVLKNGAWGFAGTSDLSEAGQARAAERALETAAAASRLRRRPVRLRPVPAVRDEWAGPAREDPWRAPARMIFRELRRAENAMRKVSAVFLTRSQVEFVEQHQLFVSTEGGRIFQVLPRAGGFLQAWARRGSDIQRRSYPSPSGLHRVGGVEVVRSFAFPRHAGRIAREAAALLDAPPCPTGPRDLLLTDASLALQLHETFGHALELDRVFGHEDNFGGRTYFDPALLGRFRAASPEVSVNANGLLPGAVLPRKYDDEGVPLTPVDLIRNGVFCGFLASRETAAAVARLAPGKDVRPHGSAMAQDGLHLPLIRMVNLNLRPGRASLGSIVRGTEDGLLLDTESAWSVDTRREDFVMGAEMGRLIRRGRPAGVVRRPAYRGRSQSFWRACDAVADAASWKMWGFADCGKGGPVQHVFVTHGVSAARFRNVSCFDAGRPQGR